MKSLSVFACVSGIVFGVSIASSALAESYECTMRDTGPGGWVGSKIVLAIDRKEEVGAALDFAIQSVHKTAIPVEVTKRKDHLWRFKWKVVGVKTSNAGTTTVSYSALLNTNTRSVTLRGILHGADNNISGRGVCKLIR